jgi:hypothetical protein
MPSKRTVSQPEKTPATPARAKPPVRRRTDPDKAPRKANVGKETKLSLTRMNAIVNLVSGGNYIKTACAFSGIGENTFHRWRMRGELEMDRLDSTGKNADLILEQFEGKDHTETDALGNPAEKASGEYMWRHRPAGFLAAEWPYVVFAHQIKRASAAAEIRAVHNIQTAGKTQWQAQAWWLERTRPGDYGRRDRLGLEGTTGEPIRTESKHETVVTVDALSEALERALGGS